MKKLIKRIKLIYLLFVTLRKNKFNDEDIIKLIGYFVVEGRKLPSKELKCTLIGHKWNNNFDPKIVTDRSIRDRTFCENCGVMYHKLNYKK